MRGVKNPPMQFTIEDFPRKGSSITYRLKNGLYSYQVTGKEEVFTPYKSYPKVAAAVRLRYKLPSISGRGRWATTEPIGRKSTSQETSEIE